MSHQVEHESGSVLDPEDGSVFALSSAHPRRAHPIEDNAHENDHYALIYETASERNAAAVPFIRSGLEQGERCLYIVDDRSSERDEAIEALRAAGVDVDDARQSGALTFYTAQETYLREQPFEPEAMIAFYADVVDETLAGYNGFRVVAGIDWIEEVGVEDFMAYEGRVNAVFEDSAATALCMYDRARLPPSVIRDVIRTHPHLIYNGELCHNFYYTPPEELFGAEEPDREVDRLLGTLRDRTEAKREVAGHKRFLRELNEITASPEVSFEAKLQALFELGCERFDLDLGAMARVDPQDDWFEVEHVNDDHEHFEPGVELPLSETYCTAATDIKDAGSVSDPEATGYDDIIVYQDFGIRAYLGTYIEVEGGPDRTFFFVGSRPKVTDFTDDERAFIRLMGQWAKHELERRQRERFLRVCYEITSDATRTFEERLEQLLELGCEWFDLEMAGVNSLPSWDGKFRLEKGVGLGVDAEDEPLWTDPGEGCFCRQTITRDAPVSRTDVRDTDWADDSIFRDFGLTSYLGTKVSSGSTPYGTLWFGSTEPRERPFSDTERTFIELMGQWVSYEIYRREHVKAQRELYDIAADTDRSFDEKLQAMFELGCDQFGMDLGGLARVDVEADVFEVESTSGENDNLVPGKQYPLSETYCFPVADEGGTVAITDPMQAGYEGKLCYDRFGVRTYLGTRLEFDCADDRTFWFVSQESRAQEFSDADLTFHHLMGQWVQYELDRHHREATLEETIHRLRQTNDRLEQFAYAASHDLQEPLRMVSSYLQLLDDQYADVLDADAQEYIEFAVGGADRMREMVDDLLTFSRVDQRDGAVEPVDCSTLLDRVQADLRIQIEDAGAEVVVGSLPTVRADPEQLEQLFTNLVSNAIKYNDADVPRVELTATEGPDTWTFSVADNGIGIDPAKTDQIFEVFNRLHHDDDYPGTGIGLALCQEIIDNHGGDIRVESDPGEGSTFAVTLPKPSTD